jgi:hypothetical protein
VADTTIACPSCDKKVRLPDAMIGKKVKCPGCQKVFTAEVDEEPVDEIEDFEEEREQRVKKSRRDDYDDGEDEGRRPARRRESEESASTGGSSDEGWGNVASGAFLQVLSHSAFALFITLGLIITLIELGGPMTSSGGLKFMGFMGQLKSIINLVAVVLALLAACSFVLGPQRSRGFALATVAMSGAMLLSIGGAGNELMNAIMSEVRGAGGRGGIPPQVAALLAPHNAHLTDWARLTVLSFYMVSVAGCLKKRGLAGTMKLFAIITGSVLGGILLVDLIIYSFSPPTSNGFAVTMVILNDLATLTALVWGLILFLDLGKSARRAA